ncbi:hypothetical protein [Streptomyces profundus]|uniref:hypothetical protein n=1 Tax=Streptomyces profundus TaxID=2867410 RepID=UPI001D163493|nr:hypothetical protein [Streptomyces sp. MA3_2.13]UED86628.1 hypothetical protein K4G22_22525 [Streptomyces sp. MA3_2.13]
MTFTRTKLVVAALATAASLTLAGCGGDDDESESTTDGSAESPAASDADEPADEPADDEPAADDEAGDEAALEQAVRDYTVALFAPDADTAHGLLSARCAAEMPAATFAALADQSHQEYGAQEIENISVDEIDGDSALVSYGIGIPQFETEAQPWTREDGGWRWDAC